MYPNQHKFPKTIFTTAPILPTAAAPLKRLDANWLASKLSGRVAPPVGFTTNHNASLHRATLTKSGMPELVYIRPNERI